LEFLNQGLDFGRVLKYGIYIKSPLTPLCQRGEERGVLPKRGREGGFAKEEKRRALPKRGNQGMGKGFRIFKWIASVFPAVYQLLLRHQRVKRADRRKKYFLTLDSLWLATGNINRDLGESFCRHISLFMV